MLLSMHLKEIAYGGSYATVDSSYYYKGQTWTTVLISLYMLPGFEQFKVFSNPQINFNISKGHGCVLNW